MLLLALLLTLLLRMPVVKVENSCRDGGGDEGGEKYKGGINESENNCLFF